VFTFDKYRLRKAEEADRAMCQKWINEDPDHAGCVTPDFFLKQEPGAEAYLMEDENGPLFFFKMSRAIRISIQFGPSATREERDRNAEALEVGFGWLLSQAQDAVVREMIFESTVVPLIRFCENRFGFKKAPDDLVCGIAPPKAPPAAENAARAEQQ
jgi:hypothetical protein